MENPENDSLRDHPDPFFLITSILVVNITLSFCEA